MSLKDRLTNTLKQTKSEEKPQEEYYTSGSATDEDKLGIIDTLLADDEINYISVYGAKNIFIEKNGAVNKTTLTFRDEVQLENMIRKLAKEVNPSISSENFSLNFNHKRGVNVCACLPPLSNPASIIVKCYKDKFANLQYLLDNLAFSKEMALVLEMFLSLKLNILIAGGKNTLKTTLLSAMAKKLPQNDRAAIFDYMLEFEINSPNVINYNLSNLEDEKIKEKLFDAIFSSNPDKVFINDPKEDDFSLFQNYIKRGFRGIIATTCANSAQEAIDKTERGAFDVVIFVKSQKENNIPIRKVESISTVSKENVLKNIFYINNSGEYASSGSVPEFFGEETNASLNKAIFEASYKHTCSQNELGKYSSRLKAPNPEVLKKFKKVQSELIVPDEAVLSTMDEEDEK